ncbi:Asp/Glu racemase [Alphaproteobacteria bacterium]|nr:Asp/Glu racemase [Alphaproteobacteria bacterium]
MDDQNIVTHLPFHQIAAKDRARQMGLVTLETDLTIEDELRFFISGAPPLSLSLLHSRIAMDDEVSADTLTRMEGRFAGTLALFPPGHDFDVIGYGCTSASLLIGEDRVQDLIKAHTKAAHVTTPITAAKRALTTLGAQKIGYMAPYVSAISQQMCTKFTADGFPVMGAATFGEGRDSIVGRIAPDAILDAITSLANDTPDIEAIFVSCTSLKCASIIEAAEARLGIPVISSNSAMAWDMIRLAGVTVDTAGKGRLFADN